MSSKLYDGAGRKKLKSTLKVLYTHAKCIKFGIMDSKYVNERSAWNYPNIIYLHGWGHTMAGGHEKDHSLCDFGTGDTVEMEIDFEKGEIRWKINNK